VRGGALVTLVVSVDRCQPISATPAVTFGRSANSEQRPVDRCPVSRSTWPLSRAAVFLAEITARAHRCASTRQIAKSRAGDPVNKPLAAIRVSSPVDLNLLAEVYG
jgi:hypothetical protein